MRLMSRLGFTSRYTVSMDRNINKELLLVRDMDTISKKSRKNSLINDKSLRFNFS